eukprot:357475-Chlamydomonas_euryale.AAC.2
MDGWMDGWDVNRGRGLVCGTVCDDCDLATKGWKGGLRLSGRHSNHQQERCCRHALSGECRLTLDASSHWMPVHTGCQFTLDASSHWITARTGLQPALNEVQGVAFARSKARRAAGVTAPAAARTVLLRQ